MGDRIDVLDQDGQYSNWDYDCQNQLGTDFYFTTAFGWSTLTSLQWYALTPDAWDVLPAIGGAASYAFEYTNDPTGNRVTQTDADTGGIVTNTYDDANRMLTSFCRSGSSLTNPWCRVLRPTHGSQAGA